MGKDTISRIESGLSALSTADKKKKAAILKLLRAHKKELHSSSKGRAKRAESLSKKLASAIEKQEAAHPQLVRAVNEICRELATLGI